ncbi:Uncharacterised protein [Vibrio cholerae]|uniref:Uncharacterized protein n=1 Tax=Vibrio cholerae TaxID=666 RepID=A0A656B1N5_VIBCL|nr:Uncharacterised protein [Vibrio cholerae]CSB40168.1 Uncharacterised protein [Vibrio cholerae]CSC02405.1 Uncharacterised protein [Vibrio cholerae]CSD21679.1 Uncharacterised protein [Vibrio cholerae]CSD23187.1 Uncharacterised protein [Vibrio cholerae]
MQAAYDDGQYVRTGCLLDRTQNRAMNHGTE